MRGEKITRIAPKNCGSESPPRGRGKVHDFHQIGRSAGITPAWAGKSRRAGRCAAASGDHPRVGGEKRMKKSSHTETKGSPPRRRGKGSKADVECLRSRITLAWAGKRRQLWRLSMSRQDHPRVGGEKASTMTSVSPSKGSPPHGRGKEIKAKVFEGMDRITPAWAGKSPASQPWSPPLWMMVIRPRP